MCKSLRLNHIDEWFTTKMNFFFGKLRASHALTLAVRNMHIARDNHVHIDWGPFVSMFTSIPWPRAMVKLRTFIFPLFKFICVLNRHQNVLHRAG
jgi:hypothetical protein